MSDRDPELRAEAVRLKRIRRFPPGSCCEECGVTRPLVWTQDGSIRCYAHVRGKAGIEEDHIAGRANFGSLTVRLDANAHRRITELRSMLGMDDWPRAEEGGPLVGLAHLLGGIGSLLILLAEWLLQMADDIHERFDPRFWEGLPLNPIC